jgi:hypothetical protein
VLKHCAANRKRRLSALPNVGPYIYDVKISGYIYIYIYIQDINMVSVNLQLECRSQLWCTTGLHYVYCIASHILYYNLSSILYPIIYQIFHIPRFISGFDGLVVSRSRVQPKPSDFFGRKNPQHAFLRKRSKAVGPVSYIYGTLKNHCDYMEVGSKAKFCRTFLARVFLLR